MTTSEVRHVASSRDKAVARTQYDSACRGRRVPKSLPVVLAGARDPASILLYYHAAGRRATWVPALCSLRLTGKTLGDRQDPGDESQRGSRRFDAASSKQVRLLGARARVRVCAHVLASLSSPPLASPPFSYPHGTGARH